MMNIERVASFVFKNYVTMDLKIECKGLNMINKKEVTSDISLVGTPGMKSELHI